MIPQGSCHLKSSLDWNAINEVKNELNDIKDVRKIDLCMCDQLNVILFVNLASLY